VVTLRDIFVYRAASTATVDGITILSAVGGVGRWERLQVCDPSWAQQLDWGIDPLTGNDQNAGTAASPLASAEEWARRISPTRPVASGMVVELISSLPSANPIRWDVMLPPGPSDGSSGTRWCLKGRRALMASGALTGYTPLSRTTGSTSRNVVTAVLDFTPYIGDTIVMTSGPGALYSAQIQGGGVNTATVTPFALDHQSDSTTPPAAPALQPAIVAGNTFEIRRTPTAGFSPQLTFSGGGFGSQTSNIQVKWIRGTLAGFSQNALISSNIINRAPSSIVYVIGSYLHAAYAGDGIIRVQNSFIGGGPCLLGNVRIYAGGTIPNPVGFATIGHSVGPGGNVAFDGDFASLCSILIGAGSSVMSNFLASARLANVGFFIDAGGGVQPGVQVQGGGFCEIRNGEYGSHVVYGIAPNSFGIRINSGGKLTYVTTKPSINGGLGVGRESIVGGTDTLYTSWPFVNTANLAMAAVGV
jgi:hypothetical protein